MTLNQPRQKQQENRGSALLIALVIIVIIAGVGGAFLLEATYRFKRNESAIESDEVQVACDANLERVRFALYIYRRDDTWDWNDILAYCSDANVDAGGAAFDDPNLVSLGGTLPANISSTGEINTNSTLSVDPVYRQQLLSSLLPIGDITYLKTEYEELKNTDEFEGHGQASRYAGYYTEDDAPLPTNSTLHSSLDQTLFCRTFPFAEGGCYIFVKDNDDGDDDYLTDSDERLIIVITCTFDDGTQHQIETLLALETDTSSAPPSRVPPSSATETGRSAAIRSSTGPTEASTGSGPGLV